MNLPAWLYTFGADIVGFVLSVVLLAVYHLYLRQRVRRNPAYTVQAVNVMARSAWVERIMKNEDGILAVQTLRNSTMAATFLASTAVLLIIGVLTLSEQGDKLGSGWHSLNVIGATRPELWITKLLMLMLDLFVAFFSFSMSIRVFNHVGYMINVPKAAGHKAISSAMWPCTSTALDVSTASACAPTISGAAGVLVVRTTLHVTGHDRPDLRAVQNRPRTEDPGKGLHLNPKRAP